MNRERLTILRDHLAGLPDEKVSMVDFFVEGGTDMEWGTIDEARHRVEHECGTAACICGWTLIVFNPHFSGWGMETAAMETLGLQNEQRKALFRPEGFEHGIYARKDTIAAIQSMLDSPDDDALPIWPVVEEA